MKVAEIDRQDDRTLLYSAGERDRKPFSRYIIAHQDVEVNVGDIVEYEPDGGNFGWFIRVRPNI